MSGHQTFDESGSEINLKYFAKSVSLRTQKRIPRTAAFAPRGRAFEPPGPQRIEC